MVHDYQVTGRVIGCAIEVHKNLGPGLKEDSYENALCEALARQNIKYERERTFQSRIKASASGSIDLISSSRTP